MNARNDLLWDKLELRHPLPTDGYALNQLVAASPPLDTNSVYCNLLQCQHFADTSVAALLNGKLVGFISAYCPPNDSETLFVWQVVVSEQLRGSGLAKRMLNWLIEQPATEQAQRLTTSITPDNRASWALFESFARDCGAIPVKSMLFESRRHFAGAHDDEYLLQIAPLPNRPGKPMALHLDDLRGSLRSSSRRWLG
uniref:diaminobutyrate acetyltransferase n=1 Tax=Cellvibrio fontiphilus TaxID=1815559 RepID=UPI002B4C19F9|nr:diaminobutyrate acetyltransferase [Cellvibrio fontiphilus]